MDIVVLQFDTVYTKGKTRHRVLYGPRDGLLNSNTWEYVDFLNPANLKIDEDDEGNHSANLRLSFMNARWAVIGPLYEAWLASGEIPEDGIPLVAWDALNKDQCRELNRHAIKTVEDLAAAGDGALSKIQLPDIRRLRDLAKTYLDGREGTEVATKLNDAMAEIELLKEALAEQMAKEAKPRGRPKKEAA